MNATIRRVLIAAFIVAAWLDDAGAQEEFAPQELAACRADIAAQCKGVQRMGGRIIKCLQEHRADLSAECKATVTPSDYPKPDEGVKVTVTIDKIKPDKKGVLFVNLSDAATFPSAKRTVIVPIAGDTVVVTFKGLKPDDYAVFAFHDENQNGWPDMGDSSEGFSANGIASAPSDFAAFAMKVVRDTQLTMSMTYP
jgi:uncharacterized protein (DUF2141 family)